MKSVALAATNSGLNALMTEFRSKALWETETCEASLVFRHQKLLKHSVFRSVKRLVRTFLSILFSVLAVH